MRIWINKISNSTFFKYISILFISNIILTASSFFSNIYIVRNLSPSDYGVFNSLLALLMLTIHPLGVFSLVIARFVSLFYSLKEFQKLFNSIKKFSMNVLFLSILCLFIFFLFRENIAYFLKIPSSGLITFTGIVIFSSYLSSLPGGILQGIQEFKGLGLCMIFSGITKFIFIVIFIELGLRIFGALSGYIGSNLLVLGLGTVLILSKFKKETKIQKVESIEAQKEYTSDIPSIYKYFSLVFLTTTAYMFISNIDMILVKHFFTPDEAGSYAVAQLVGRIVFYVATPITLVMFPKITERIATKQSTLPLLKKSLLYTGVLVSLAVMFINIFPEIIFKIITGRINSTVILLGRFYSINMALMVFINIMMYYFLSLHTISFALIIITGGLLEAVLIYLFHHSLFNILFILFFVFVFILFLSFVAIFLNKSCQYN